MADEKDDTTPEWAKGILTGLTTLLSDMDSRLKKVEEQNAGTSKESDTNEHDKEPKERKPRRSTGFLSAWDRD